MEALVRLALYLPKLLLRKALVVARTMESTEEWAGALAEFPCQVK